MVDKDYCCSSYLALRTIEKDNVNFFEGLDHKNATITPLADRIQVGSAEEIDAELQKVFDSLQGKKLGIMLSGGMDSAILAAYMPGSDAYTFRFLGGEFQRPELERAEYYAKVYDMKLHYVDISWEVVEKYLPICFEANQAPVHSIVPQIYKAAMMSKEDGCEKLVLGECADNRFGGLDRAVSKDWTFDEFVEFYTFLDPKAALVNPVDMTYVFEPYRRDGNMIDYNLFMQTVFARESETSYVNIFTKADVQWVYPYENLAVRGGLNLERIRRGDTKYLLRDLFRLKYPGYPVPDKNPMPRPVDVYFKDWAGPTRPEFRKDIPMDKLSGNQKWQLWCLETFLNAYDPACR